MRLTPTLSGLLSCLLIGGMAEAFAAESAPKQTIDGQATALMETLEARKLPQPNPFGDSELELFEAMADGLVPVDPAFCERIKLVEITDGLLPVLNQPFPSFIGGGQIVEVRGNLIAARLFALRGHLLCQQGKVAEGQAWLLKPRLLARRPGSDLSLMHALTAMALEGIGLQTTAPCAETWSKADRLACLRSAEALTPLADLSTAIRKDNESLPENQRMPALIAEFRLLNSAQQQALIKERFGPLFGTSIEQQDTLRLLQGLVSNLTPESWVGLIEKISGELAPLTIEKAQAFATHNAAALKEVLAEKAKPSLQATATAPSADKAEALYRVLIGPGVEGTARNRLNLVNSAKLLEILMQKGAAFDATDLAGVTTADGKPLRLGTYEGNKAVVGDDGRLFLTLGRVK
jgi:hypothetical protein